MAYCTCSVIPYSENVFRSFEFPSRSNGRNYARGSKSCTSQRLSVENERYNTLQLSSAWDSVDLKYGPAETFLWRCRKRRMQKRIKGFYCYPPRQVLSFIQNTSEDQDGSRFYKEPDSFSNRKICYEKQIHGSPRVCILRSNTFEEKGTDQGLVEFPVQLRETRYESESPEYPTLPSVQRMAAIGVADNRDSLQVEIVGEKFSNTAQVVRMQSIGEVNTVETEAKTCSEAYRQDNSSIEKLDGNLGSTGSRQANSLVHLPGSRRVVELLTAWDGLAGRLSPETLRSKDSQLLTAALKLTILALKDASFSNSHRLPLGRALAVAYLLADLQMDARVIAAGLLREVVEAGMISMAVVQNHLGSEVVHLIHDCIRVKKMSSSVHSLDEETASLLRKFSLTFHDIRAVIVEVTARLDALRHINTVPKYQQHILALEAMQIYAPLAHALGIGKISLELEDISFSVLFPDSYAFVQNWMATNWKDGEGVIGRCRKVLQEALQSDSELHDLIESVEVLGRVKSRFSTMKKLLKDGRSIEEIYDILGMRVILVPRSGGGALEEREKGAKACYRAMEIVTSLWKEVPGRLKDYIANPKKNGYESLHLSVYLSNLGLISFPVELQIRTAAMDALAAEGTASHGFYKGGLTDPIQARQLKEIMLTAASAAASRFQDSPGDVTGRECELQTKERDHLFELFDRNKDGVISMEEFQVAIGELGAERDDAHELMRLVDSNIDGCISSKEFQDFLSQLRSPEDGRS